MMAAFLDKVLSSKVSNLFQSNLDYFLRKGSCSNFEFFEHFRCEKLDWKRSLSKRLICADSPPPIPPINLLVVYRLLGPFFTCPLNKYLLASQAI